MKCWRSGKGSSGSRSLRLLAIAVLAYVISIQFKSASRTLQTPPSQYEDVEFEPPGASRWDADASNSQSGSVDQSNDNDVDAPFDKEPDQRNKLQEDDDRNVSNNLRGDKPSKNGDDGSGDVQNQETPKQKQISPSRRTPRNIAIGYIEGKLTTNIIKASDRSDFKEDSVPADAPQINPSWYDPNAEEFIDGYDWAVCEPMYDWQLKSYPNCNKFHELDLLQLRMINTGGSRIAFEMRQKLDGKEAKFVYKTVKYHKDITMKRVEEQRRDSTVMERTSSSQFIPDIHGYCSLGVMMDFMPEGNMHDYIKGARLAGGSTLPPVDRLRLSIHVATSVADLHTIDNTPMPSIFHDDICCHQYLFQNGVFKLNDFNYARAIYINKKTNEQCTRTSFGMAMWKARSLEEHQLHLKRSEYIPAKPDKIDVWMMGDLIYYLLTDLYTFEKPKNLSWQESGRELLAGRRSPYPENIEKSNDPAHVAVKKALDMCWTQDWRERPSARSISDYLIGQLREVTGEEKPDFRVVLPERDPKQRSTESDYDKYND